MTVVEILKTARALISTPETWVRGHFRAKRGDIECYCAHGAVLYGVDAYYPRKLEAREALYNVGLSPIDNDNLYGGGNHATMLAKFDQAIANEITKVSHKA